MLWLSRGKSICPSVPTWVTRRLSVCSGRSSSFFLFLLPGGLPFLFGPPVPETLPPRDPLPRSGLSSWPLLPKLLVLLLRLEGLNVGSPLPGPTSLISSFSLDPVYVTPSNIGHTSSGKTTLAADKV